MYVFLFFFFSSRRRHTRWPRDWSSDVCSSDLRRRPGHSNTFTTGRYSSAPAAALATTSVIPAEIGRASCRERVKVWVVGGAVRKKEEEKDVRGARTERGSSA